jgi:mono/diheme cytochrome c family protein
MVGLAGLAAAAAALADAAGTDPAEMVGARRCGECHPSALAVWADGPHARAHRPLHGERAADPRCVQCHGVDQLDKSGVQCEACHGPGRHYAYRYVMKDPVLSRLVGLDEPDVETCRGCHTATAPTLQPFDYDRMWPAVAHGAEPDDSEQPEQPDPSKQSDQAGGR